LKKLEREMKEFPTGEMGLGQWLDQMFQAIDIENKIENLLEVI